MGKSEIEARVDAGPFMPKWLKVKNSFKALKTGTLFKPDITPSITSYDKALTDFAALKEDLKDMNKILSTMLAQANDSVTDRDKLTKELSDLTTKSKAAFQKDMAEVNKINSGKGVDTDKVVAALNDLADEGKVFIDKRKGYLEELD